jgi:hypothetical protein
MTTSGAFCNPAVTDASNNLEIKICMRTVWPVGNMKASNNIHSSLIKIGEDGKGI